MTPQSLTGGSSIPIESEDGNVITTRCRLIVDHFIVVTTSSSKAHFSARVSLAAVGQSGFERTSWMTNHPYLAETLERCASDSGWGVSQTQLKKRLG